jgi:sialate O-acetylesterase
MRNHLTKGLKVVLLLATVIIFSIEVMAEDLKRIKNLEGTWKFTVGDDPSWSEVDADDSDWDYVNVPGSWESNGFIGYNGYAWYRKKFSLNAELEGEHVLLRLGNIDDVDEVYVNGKLVGYSGTFPLVVQTAYGVPRKYPVPTSLLNPHGENVIAVRVYDYYLEGGITSGRIGIYYDAETSYLSQDLSGYWQFKTRDRYAEEAKPVYNRPAGEIFVPGYWESLGYSNYDGDAVYIKEFTLNPNINTNEDLYLVLGYIDDKDIVYLNDEKIGEVEDINRGSRNYYRIFRGYSIPDGVLRASGTNTIVVQVYDKEAMGGIYKGPVGIATKDNYKKLKARQKEEPVNYWEDIFKTIFD